MCLCIEMDPHLLASVLTQGGEQVRQLRMQLEEPFVNVELCKSLARSVQTSFETAISMAKLAEVDGSRKNSDSPQSGSDSPRSEDSEQGFRDQEQREMMCKKRKSLPKWSSQVRVCLGGGIEGPLDDGHSWRKYGQKDILGAKYPRGYYRCTYRNSQGCPATKQVQRSDSDPSIFDVSYRGIHTCVQKSPKVAQPSPRGSPTMKRSLQVTTEGLDSANSSSFSFPSTPINYVQPQSDVLFAPSMRDNQFGGTFLPNIAPATNSESNYFTGGHSSELEFAEMLTALTSTTSSAVLDVDFARGHVEFDPNFPFDGPDFF